MSTNQCTFFIRTFEPSDEEEIYQLFYDTVHYVNCKDYTEEQINIWAPKKTDLSQWRDSLSKNYTFVAVNSETGQIIGFSDLDETGYLNRGYVHKDFQGQGIGKALLLAREEKAKALSIKKLFSDVSITAKPFFEKCGYVTEKEQTKILEDVAFTNFCMVKNLST